jgi:hypothetical protein
MLGYLFLYYKICFVTGLDGSGDMKKGSSDALKSKSGKNRDK